MKYLRRSWAVIDLDNLKNNLKVIRSALNPGVKLMCVVKADAYGHGDRFVAPELERLGADWFGVSNLDEGISLRHHGVSAPVLIFGPTPADSNPSTTNIATFSSRCQRSSTFSRRVYETS